MTIVNPNERLYRLNRLSLFNAINSVIDASTPRPDVARREFLETICFNLFAGGIITAISTNGVLLAHYSLPYKLLQGKSIKDDEVLELIISRDIAKELLAWLKPGKKDKGTYLEFRLLTPPDATPTYELSCYDKEEDFTGNGYKGTYPNWQKVSTGQKQINLDEGRKQTTFKISNLKETLKEWKANIKANKDSKKLLKDELTKIADEHAGESAITGKRKDKEDKAKKKYDKRNAVIYLGNKGDNDLIFFNNEDIADDKILIDPIYLKSAIESFYKAGAAAINIEIFAKKKGKDNTPIGDQIFLSAADTPLEYVLMPLYKK